MVANLIEPPEEKLQPNACLFPIPPVKCPDFVDQEAVWMIPISQRSEGQKPQKRD
jgi:hypothetical protein